MVKLKRRFARRDSIALTGIFAAFAMASTISPAMASAGGQDLGSTDSSIGTYCAQTYVKKVPGKPEAILTHKVCGSTEKEVRAKLPVTAASTLLAQLFENPIGQAGLRTDIYADSFCDPAGWGFSDLRAANDAVRGATHIKTFNSCNGGELYTDTHYGGLCHRWSYAWEFNFPGGCNDRLHSMKLYAYPGPQ
ncbi:hypothetical protein F9C11_32180 [Amycolatopsis sp. VS8301801F10]|uniref:hypothetical protein n=1 Tax=Amycolatopsis sp. VS8301801F10 TaxID=2652442 RepID=UPI0038FC9A6C